MSPRRGGLKFKSGGCGRWPGCTPLCRSGCVPRARERTQIPGRRPPVLFLCIPSCADRNEHAGAGECGGDALGTGPGHACPAARGGPYSLAICTRAAEAVQAMVALMLALRPRRAALSYLQHSPFLILKRIRRVSASQFFTDKLVGEARVPRAPVPCPKSHPCRCSVVLILIAAGSGWRKGEAIWGDLYKGLLILSSLSFCPARLVECFMGISLHLQPSKVYGN